MRKILIAALLVTALTAGIASADDIDAWNLNERVHPELKERLTNTPEMTLTDETLPALRKNFAVAPESLPKDDAVEVHDEMINSNLRVRVYKPKKEMKEYPALLWIHGGGHILGTPEQDEALMFEFVKKVECIIAAPDYRLAPENKYPADVDDCYAALVWMTENLPVRKDKVAVAGQSAGGGLTAAVALRARDEGKPALCFQMPLYPMLDCRNITHSSYQIKDHRVWNRDFNLTAWKMYLGDINGDLPAYASPALTKDLSGLPPAYIMVGVLDPFRDEDIDYANRLMKAGVPVELHVVPGAFHGFEISDMSLPFGIRFRNEYINALAEALN